MRRRLALLSAPIIALGMAVTGVPVQAEESPPQEAAALDVIVVDGATITGAQVTGPPEERLNLVILGDGYTAAEMPTFRSQVDKHLNVLWSIEPFRSYRSYFNVYVVETPSADSGISCDPDDGNVRRDTVFSLQYARTCPAEPNARGITFGTGGSAAVDRYAGAIPGVTAQNRQVLALANTDTYGGIGGRNATTSGGSPQGPLITPHELGHSLGGLADEYPYSARGVPGGAHPNSEPSSIHHTRLTVEQMQEQQRKWWRWLGEESESGGIIDRYESGMTRSSNVWRPSEHSMMRSIGYYFDQVSREKMTEKISGRRDLNAMAINTRPTDVPAGTNEVLWVEVPHPTHHELDVTWSLNGAQIAGTHNSRNLDLKTIGAKVGDSVEVTVVDPTDFVRDPAVRASASFTQTRSWTVGTAVPVLDVPVAITEGAPGDHAVGGTDVVWIETTHPTDRVLTATWTVDGQQVPNPHNSRNLDLESLGLPAGTHTVSVQVNDPAHPDGPTDTRTWRVDHTSPTAPATLSEPLATSAGDPNHQIYYEQFTMRLDPTDDQPGHVVGEFRLNNDGWFNYHGWPDAPEGTPFLFTPAGTTIKELTYGNLGTGGVSKAPFEQTYPDFVPGYGTHLLEHRAIDAAGNIGDADAFHATVLPGEAPACDTTLTGSQHKPVLGAGVTCFVDAHIKGGLRVGPGASVVIDGGSVAGGLTADGAEAVHLYGTTVSGGARLGTGDGDVVLAGTHIRGGLSITGSRSILAGNDIRGGLQCSGAPVQTYGAVNTVGGNARCAGL